MVSISEKKPTRRTAVAKCRVRFSNAAVLPLVRQNQLKKGDVLGIARVAGIMAAKKTADLIPLCHPIAITHVSIDLDVAPPVPVSPSSNHESRDSEQSHDGPEEEEEEETKYGRIDVTATVSCDGKTGVEMEALTAAGAAALTVYDMCKAVDKAMVIDGLRVVLKEGGKSGRWVEGSSEQQQP